MIDSQNFLKLFQDQPRAAAASISAWVGEPPLAGGGGAALAALSTGAAEAPSLPPPPPPPQAAKATQVNRAANTGRDNCRFWRGLTNSISMMVGVRNELN
ncbi:MULTISPECIES: hypothetical protein [Hydrogenophaga]|uniref:hypothetical protein n=1 Tax=Hydrogenophaga TaxID=47420 RepID=UPI000ABB3581|nr:MULTISPECIES: hypothetical protein [unclassified Hydrogenophaga]